MGVLSNAKARLATAIALAGLLSPGIAPAQSLKEEIVGAWRLVSIYNEAQGVKRHLLGENPVGLMQFDRSGSVSQFLSKPGLPRFATPNRMQGTDQEYREVMQGMISGFGTYTVDGDTVTIKWIASSYPNRAGTEEKRVYRIVGDEMSAVNPAASVGGTAHAKYARAR
jgi:hypothetical protein